MDAALAHTNPNKVEAAYARSDLFARRRTLMEQWAAYRVVSCTEKNEDCRPDAAAQ